MLVVMVVVVSWLWSWCGFWIFVMKIVKEVGMVVVYVWAVSQHLGATRIFAT